MQTFLPLPDLAGSVACLDDVRLGNQVYRECKTLINGGWANHPASKMWRGYEGGLVAYALAGAYEMARRTKPNGEPKWREEVVDRWISYYDASLHGMVVELPPWFGDPAIHSSHRAALLHKNPEWYTQWGWDEHPAVPDEKGSLPYVWPV